VISSALLEGAQRQQLDATLTPAGYRCGDLFVPVPPLRQEALFRLMRRSRFCLASNRFPEPFGSMFGNRFSMAVPFTRTAWETIGTFCHRSTASS
jgi:hypothetical protein